jgi:hypothetical protein
MEDRVTTSLILGRMLMEVALIPLREEEATTFISCVEGKPATVQNIFVAPPTPLIAA